MNKIIINEDQLSNIINNYCSCGGRGPNDNPCSACAIWHELVSFTPDASQQAVQVDRLKVTMKFRIEDLPKRKPKAIIGKFPPAT